MGGKAELSRRAASQREESNHISSEKTSREEGRTDQTAEKAESSPCVYKTAQVNSRGVCVLVCARACVQVCARVCACLCACVCTCTNQSKAGGRCQDETTAVREKDMRSSEEQPTGAARVRGMGRPLLKGTHSATKADHVPLSSRCRVPIQKPPNS